MRVKEGTTIIFGVILATTLALVAFRSTSSEAKVCIDPIEKTVYLHETFAINVDVTDVWHLQAYSVIIYYHTIPIDAVSVELPPGHFLEPIRGEEILRTHEDLRITRKETDDNFNTTHGRIWVSVQLLSPSRLLIQYPHCKMRDIRQLPVEGGRTGSGTLFTITFNCTSRGTSVLCLSQTKLSGKDSPSIAHIRVNGLIRTHW